MNKTIKVIDLLNKISNGEEVPKKIKVFNHIFKRKLDIDGLSYYLDLDGYLPLLSFISGTATLNTEVEIIEEEPEIDIQGIEELEKKTGCAESNSKINELIKAIKQLDKKIKEK